MRFLLTAAGKTGLDRDLAEVSDATWEQFHFDTQWCSSTATAALCGRRTFPEAGLQSKQNFTLAQKKIELFPTYTSLPPSLPRPPPRPESLPLSHPLSHSQSASGTQTGGDVRNCTQLCALSVTGTCTEDPDLLQLMLLDADWSWLSVGLVLHSAVIFFLSCWPQNIKW